MDIQRVSMEALDQDLPGVTIVIPARNAANTIGRTLDSLENQATKIPLDILIIDNKSDDQTINIVSAHPIGRRRTVRVIVQKTQSGLASSYNVGWRNAQYNKIIYMHADCYLLDVNAIDLLMEALDMPGIVAVETAPIIPISAWDDMGFWDKVTNSRYVGRDDHGYGGRFGAVRRNTMEALGGYDEQHFFSAGEDVDIAVRLSKIGVILYSSMTVVHGHEHPKKSTIIYVLRKQWQLGQGFGALIRKHGIELWKLPVMRLLIMVHGLKFFLLAGLLFPYIRLPCLVVLLAMVAAYSWKALFLADKRVILIPLVVTAQFVSFLVATAVGLVFGRQISDYK